MWFRSQILHHNARQLESLIKGIWANLIWHLLTTGCVTWQLEVLLQYFVPPSSTAALTPRVPPAPGQSWVKGKVSAQVVSQSGTTSRLLTAGSCAAACQAALLPEQVLVPAVPTPFPFQKLYAKHMHVAKNKVLAHWSYLSGLYLSGLPINSFVRNKNCFLKHEEDIQWQTVVWSKSLPPPFQGCRQSAMASTFAHILLKKLSPFA